LPLEAFFSIPTKVTSKLFLMMTDGITKSSLLH
jgi:hypothetical protein